MFCRKNDRDSYAATIGEAWKRLCARDARAAAAAAGAAFSPNPPEIVLVLLGVPLRISPSLKTVRREDGAGPSLAEQVLALHHLALSDGSPLSGRKAAFREIPGCQFYNTTFTAHTIVPMIRTFGNDEGRFEKACFSLGGEREAGSGIVVRLPALPRVPLWLCYWAGDDEMPPGAQLLYDSSVAAHLPAEDIAVLGEYTAHKVMEAAGDRGKACLYEH